jgi:hypothetical protein
MKVLYAAFLLLRFGFVIFWHKYIAVKATRKMLTKVTPEGWNKFSCFAFAHGATQQKP